MPLVIDWSVIAMDLLIFRRIDYQYRVYVYLWISTKQMSIQDISMKNASASVTIIVNGDIFFIFFQVKNCRNL